jgi:hypothetical protein
MPENPFALHLRRGVPLVMKMRVTGTPWVLPPLNSDAERVRAASSVASGILAGFSVTAIATLLTADRSPGIIGPALLAFSGAASAALLALSYQSWAQGVWSRPDDYLAWNPRARVNATELQRVRRLQRKDMTAYMRLY